MGKEKDKIDNLGHYLSRVEVEESLFKKLKKE